MKQLCLLACLILVGCTSSRVSRFDDFEKVKVDKMVGNDVQFHIFSRAVVSLNAMREARWPEASTNQLVAYQTNYVVQSVTNLTVTTSWNEQIASNTNKVAAPKMAVLSEGGSALAESNNVVAVIGDSADSTTDGLTVSSTRNESVATAPNQTVLARTIQKVTMRNNQGTTNSNGHSVVFGNNEVMTTETNMVITTTTNQVITTSTNMIVTAPQQQVFEYYLYTEIAPADFPLQPGESLIVLTDGKRHGLTSAQPQSGWQGRRGRLTTFYKASSEVIEDIANAREVRIRLKSSTGGIERRLSASSRQQFRTFLVKHFGKETETAETKESPVSSRS